MKTKDLINLKALIVFLIMIFMILSMPMSVFADEEGDRIKEEDMPMAGSLEGFWMRYNPEDIDYHVIDPMEKICIIGDEEPLEIRITKEENDGSLSDHFLEVTVNHIHTSADDMDKIYYEPENTPDYEMSEEDGILSFIFSKDILECPKDIKRYEFVFTFDDGKAYSLVWVTKKNDMLEYTESGHVWFIPAPIVTLEDMGIDGITAVNKLEQQETEETNERGFGIVSVLVGITILIIVGGIVVFIKRFLDIKKKLN